MIRLYEVRMEINDGINELKAKCEEKLGVAIPEIKLIKKSIDARKKHDIFYSCTVDCNVEITKTKSNKIKYTYVEDKKYSFPSLSTKDKIIIAGSGPAGLFAALTLSRCGVSPIVIERGQPVDERVKTINDFFHNSVLNPECNIQFGEGGAGTFSDGKLNTGVNDLRIKFVIEEFVKHGAPENILYDSLPHIGTDILRVVIKNIRNEIIENGGTFLFDTKLNKINLDNNKLVSIMVINNGEEKEINCDKLLLAIGHSARDTIKMLYNNGLRMDKKVFSVGLRIEHLQKDINNALYGDFSHSLPPAPYKLWMHLPDGNSLYTFCMCPGGYVINAASEHNRIVTNGMSNNSRDGENANSALLVNIKYNKDDSVFSGMMLQEKIEHLAYKYSGENYSMPVQLLGDFTKGKKSTQIGDILPTVSNYSFMDLNKILPDYVSNTIKTGVLQFEKKIKGFSRYDAVLTGPETRSSSPVTFYRDKDTMKTNIEGIYCAGEGGGHAGGITSAAVDGIKVAEKILI